MSRYTQSDAPMLIKRRKAFEISALSARSYYDVEGGLRDDLREGHMAVWPERGARYVVFTYTTPIAWIDKNGVAVITPHRYSITTSTRHMSKLWTLEDDPGGNRREKERARKRYDKAIAEFHRQQADQRRELDRIRAQRRRAEQREVRRVRRIQEQEEAAAVASILGRGGGGVILYGLDGEREAIASIERDAHTRDAGNGVRLTRA